MGFAAFLILGNIISLANGPQLGLVETVIASGDESLRDQMIEEERREDRIMLIVSAILVPILLMGSALPARPWGHAYGFVVMIVSSLLCLPIVFTIPLFIFWIKPEATRYFTR
jgi:hypothetical protein